MYFFIQQYVPIFLLLIIAIGLSGVILGASYLLGIQKPDTEKVSVYECGRSFKITNS
jgi:NADH-quinone oxidoreductase subunit A